MTARTWCNLWKPSIQRGTELLKYQTQRWIPLQTCSLFFTVGPRPHGGRMVTSRIASRLLRSQVSVRFHFRLRPMLFVIVYFYLQQPSSFYWGKDPFLSLK